MPDGSSLPEIKISQLPVGTQANLTDQLEANQAGVTASITVGQVATAVAGTLPAPPTIPTTLPPSGAAGGALSGTYPNPGLAVPYPTTLPPSGAAGGDLQGTYPNPTLKVSGTLANYLPLAGGTLTGALTGTTAAFGGTLGVTGIATMPTITAPAATGLVLNAPTGQRVNMRVNNVDVVQTQVNAMFPATTNAVVLGGASNRWSGVYSVLGDFSGALTGTTATLSGTIPPTSNDTTVPTTAWVKANAGGTITVSDTAPGSPTAGALWWNSVLGTMFIYFNDGNSSQWVVASPTAPNKLLQEISVETGAYATGTTAIPPDDTIPQITEGDQYMQLAITPLSATSKLIIKVTMYLASTITPGNTISAALFQDSTANALAAGVVTTMSTSAMQLVTFTHAMVSGTTSSTTFKVRAGANVGGTYTTTFNGQAGARVMGGVMASSIVIREIAP